MSTAPRPAPIDPPASPYSQAYLRYALGLLCAVYVVNFVDRDRLATLAELVCPGGHAIVTTFTTERPGARPPLDYCLRPGELAQRFADRTRLAFESDGRAGVLASF